MTIHIYVTESAYPDSESTEIISTAELIQIKYCDLSQQETETCDTNFKTFDCITYVGTKKTNLYSQR